MTLQALWSEGHNLQFLNGIQGLKAFKIVQDGKGKRKLVGFFETWESLHKTLNSKPVWEKVTLAWCTHTTPNHTKKAKKPPISKSAEIIPDISYADMVKSG